jgi:ribonuclease HI
LTSDSCILNIVEHCHINLEADELRNFSTSCIQYNFNEKEKMVIQNEIKKLLKLQVIIEVEACQDQILSPIFVRPKKNGEYRMVLNLKQLNKFIPYKHFKMETFENALTLISKGTYMASVDLRHAYYSIQIAEEQQKYFRFAWDGKIFQYTCLANGVSEGPRLFTKLLKPVYAKLRSMGYVNSGFIDDSLLCGDSKQECTQNVLATTNLMTNVGFMINEEKSVLIPTRKIQYLGNIIDSDEMIVQLPEERQNSIISGCKSLLKKPTATIREVAKIIGLIVASFSAVEYGKLHYRQLEINKIYALQKSYGNYDSLMEITNDMKTELHWWIENLSLQVRHIFKKPVEIEMYTDASRLGWGAKLGKCKIGGRWNNTETNYHINALELLAINYALKAFKDNLQDKHVKIFTDNTTAVNYINSMGGIKSPVCNNISVDIWTWCISRNIWLTCTHIAGSDNIEADAASRCFKDHLEWKLDTNIFQHICNRWGKPDIDMFASRLNAQLPVYCSWKPDPNCTYVDAFTLNWNTVNHIYFFPPFSLIGRCLQKVRQEKAKGIVIAPLWPTQPWFTRLLELLVDTPVIICKKKGLLTLPHTNQEHPLTKKLQLIACKVSGNSFENEDFQKNLPISSCRLGNVAQRNNTVFSSKGGFATAVKGKSIQFLKLWKM